MSTLTPINLTKSTYNNLILWYSNCFESKDLLYFPFSNKLNFYTSLEDLKIELLSRNSCLKDVPSQVLINSFITFNYKYDEISDSFKKRNKNIFVPILNSFKLLEDYSSTTLVPLKYITRELNSRKIDLTIIKTKVLLNWLRIHRFDYFDVSYDNYYIPNIDNWTGGVGLSELRCLTSSFVEKEGLFTNIDEIKKELSTREHVPSKANNKIIRQLCAKHKINKDEARKMLLKG